MVYLFVFYCLGWRKGSVEERTRPLAEPSLSGWASGGNIVEVVLLEVVLMEIDPYH